MKTPMQELLEWVRATLPMDLDTPQMIEAKIESMLQKERDALKLAFENERDLLSCYEDGSAFQEYYNETFNTKDK